MKSLINELDSVAGKTAYQTYTITHGMETINILVPLKEVKDFEVAFNGTVDKTKKALLEVVKAHNGKVKK